jgi:hypothetical protein
MVRQPLKIKPFPNKGLFCRVKGREMKGMRINLLQIGSKFGILCNLTHKKFIRIQSVVVSCVGASRMDHLQWLVGRIVMKNINDHSPSQKAV